MQLKKRVDWEFDRYGESFLVNGATLAKGVFQEADQSRLSMWFDSIEQASILRPALVLLASADASFSVGDSIARDGRTYIVKKIGFKRVRDTAVMKIAMLA